MTKFVQSKIEDNYVVLSKSSVSFDQYKLRSIET